jgi:hypothetical protein
MFESGCVKLLSHDRSWHSLTALNVHYETQPLPTWIGWGIHQLPAWLHQASTIVMFAIELLVPFLIFAPRRLRQIGCIAMVTLQVLILLTGNYCFFNLLTIALCLLLLDDAAVIKLMPRKTFNLQVSSFNLRKWPIWVTVPLACIVVAISLTQLTGMFRLGRWSRLRIVNRVYEWVAPLRLVNTYGLFAVMTTNRLEIVIEGSNDGKSWLPYEFKHKPGDLKRRPGFVAPHQPRLDWQMWFAALGDYQHNPWLVNFSFRLLQGSPQVIGLLERNPFPQAPPRYIRAVVYDYRFTDFATRWKTGAWWKRDPKRLYLPVISLEALQGKQ